MIHTIPNNVSLNPSTNEDFLVSGRIWEPISNEQFDLVRSESKFAAGLSVSGIFPKKSFLENDAANLNFANDDEDLYVVPTSAAQATQAGIQLNHVVPSVSLPPSAMVTFREMLATNGVHDDYMCSREIVHRF